MGRIEDLKKELELLRKKREEDLEVKRLQKQINYEKFSQTRSGKVFNKIADIGDKAKKNLFAPPKQTGKKKKPVDVNELIRRLPQ